MLGGAGSLEDFSDIIKSIGTIGCAAGSLFVFKGKYRAVLINYPSPEEKDKNYTMKQLLQDLKTGKIDIVDVPVPQLKDESLLVSSNFSLVSKGTEKMLIDFGKSNYLKKAQQQPDKVKQVLTKIKTDGIYKTYDAVKSKLDQPIPLGYCNVGRVIESSTQLFSVGDRVVSNGYHAENVCVFQKIFVQKFQKMLMINLQHLLFWEVLVFRE